MRLRRGSRRGERGGLRMGVKEEAQHVCGREQRVEEGVGSQQGCGRGGVSRGVEEEGSVGVWNREVSRGVEEEGSVGT